MRTRPIVSRRTFLATAGATALVAVAGCQGDGDGQGENSTEEDSTQDGTETPDDGNSSTETATAMPEPEGQQVRAETITDDIEWEFDLEAGETMTVVAAPKEETGADGDIHRLNRTPQLVEINASPDSPDTAQYTPEEAGTYVLDIHVRGMAVEGGGVDVEVYVVSA